MCAKSFDWLHKNRPIASTYIISLFVIYEAIAILLICVNLIGFWETKDFSVLVTSSYSVSILAFLIHTVQNSWNHFSLIRHTLKKVNYNGHYNPKINIILIEKILTKFFLFYSQTDNNANLQLKFINYYTNKHKFYVNFFRLIRIFTIGILVYYLKYMQGNMGCMQLCTQLANFLCFRGKMNTKFWNWI